MKKRFYPLLSIFLAAVLFGLAAPGVSAQEAEPAAEEGLAKEAVTDKNDKSGTNPINFQRDLRIYNEYLWLNTAGDGNQNVTTLEFRTPFADGKWQFRTRIPVLQHCDRRPQWRRLGRHR